MPLFLSRQPRAIRKKTNGGPRNSTAIKEERVSSDSLHADPVDASSCVLPHRHENEAVILTLRHVLSKYNIHYLCYTKMKMTPITVVIFKINFILLKGDRRLSLQAQQAWRQPFVPLIEASWLLARWHDIYAKALLHYSEPVFLSLHLFHHFFSSSFKLDRNVLNVHFLRQKWTCLHFCLK